MRHPSSRGGCADCVWWVRSCGSSQAEDESFYSFYDEDEVGRFFFLKWVSEVHPPHGSTMLLIHRYKYALHNKREIAQDICDQFVGAVTDIWSSEDVDVLLEAHAEGKKPVNKGKKPTRANNKLSKIEEAKGLVVATQGRLARGTPPDLLADMSALLKDDLDEYFSTFKKSKYYDLYARSRAMEIETVHEEDFHQFRVLGVGGFGAVHAAVKKDTGALLAIKRMDKKLIKHKNRYKSCFTEFSALRALTSSFVCGLHYTYQTKDDVCLVLDLLRTSAALDPPPSGSSHPCAALLACSPSARCIETALRRRRHSLLPPPPKKEGLGAVRLLLSTVPAPPPPRHPRGPTTCSSPSTIARAHLWVCAHPTLSRAATAATAVTATSTSSPRASSWRTRRCTQRASSIEI